MFAGSTYAELCLKINPPRAEWDNHTSPDTTILLVDSANKHGTLLELVQLLTDLDLIIHKATISSDGSWILDVFHITDQFGRKVTDEKYLGYINSFLTGTTGDLRGEEVLKTCLGRPIKRTESLGENTAIELVGQDRPGLLSECAGILAYCGCDVVAAALWTHKRRVASVIYVKDSKTVGPVEDPVLQEKIAELLTNVMNDNNPAHRGKTSFSIGLTHPERRLHQLLFADRDYDHGEQRSGDVQSLEVRNCEDTNFTVIEVKSVDRPSLLFDTVCTLTDMQYVVYHAKIDSEDGYAEQEYYIKHMDGGLLDSKAERLKVEKCVQAAIERRVCQGIRLELRMPDREKLLADTTRMFRVNGLSVTKAMIETRNGEALNVFYVINAEGGLPDMRTLLKMQQEIGGPEVLAIKGEDAKFPLKKKVLPPMTRAGSFVQLVRQTSEQLLTLVGLKS